MSRPGAPWRSVALGLAAALVGVALAGGAHHFTASRRATFPPEQDVAYLPSATALRIGSVGHKELLADLLFMRAVLYFSTQLTGARNYEWLGPNIDMINELDPHFRAPYLFGSRATMYNGLPITNEMVMLSNHFCEKALVQFPNDWEFAFTVGCNYLFELKTTDPKQKAEWQRKGGEMIRRASLVGGGPAWLAGLAAKIMSDEGQADAALRYLEEAYLSVQDDKEREDIRLLLIAKRAANVGRLAAARDAFNSAWAKNLSYAPSDLFVLVGEPPSPRLDLPYLSTDEVLVAAEREDRDAIEKGREQ